MILSIMNITFTATSDSMTYKYTCEDLMNMKRAIYRDIENIKPYILRTKDVGLLPFAYKKALYNDEIEYYKERYENYINLAAYDCPSIIDTSEHTFFITYNELKKEVMRDT